MNVPHATASSPPSESEGVQRDFLALLASPPLSSAEPYDAAGPSPFNAFFAPPPAPSSPSSAASVTAPPHDAPPAPVTPIAPSTFSPFSQVTPEDDPLEQTCIFIGPPGAGKTSLLASLDAACLDQGEDGDALALVWDRQGDAPDLLQRAGRQWIGCDEAMPSTAASTAYSVELTSVHRSPLLKRRSMRVTQLRIVEEPGRLLFPSLHEADGRSAPPLSSRQQVELASATSLALVIDARRPCAETIEATLPGLLDRLASSRPGERLGRGSSSGVLSRIGLLSGRPAPRRNRLGVKRLLLLLTKVDDIADAEARAQRAAGEDVSAFAVARAIDPVGLAMEVIGARNLRRLRRALGAEAELAVGLASASGFCTRSGAAFSASSPVRSPDERLQAWAPFGVGDALRFLAYGRCGATIQLIAEDEITGVEVHPIARHAFQGAG